jgi:hypothetical protein
VIAPLVAAAALVTPWSGEFVLPVSATPVGIGIDGNVVSLAAGHAEETRTRVTVTKSRLRFSLPGRPARIVFDGRVRGRRVTGTVRQGALRGTFTLQARRPPDFRSLGLYALADGRTISVVDGGARGAFDVDGGEARGLFGAGSPYAIGSGIGVRDPVAGSARFTAGAVDWNGVRGTRVAVRHEEVRFRSGSLTLAGTLHLPPGAGPFPAVALVHGSGATPRNQVGWQLGFYLRHGVAVLSYDKRGIGQSGGTWPGEGASERNIGVYAADARAAVRFLAAQREVDRTRVGLSGMSQAGWIMPLAASREPLVRFLVLLVSPTVTQGESDAWGHGIGQGSGPSKPETEVKQDVRRGGRSGFDPLPAIRALKVPALWLWGGTDQHMPTWLSVERLAPVAAEPGRDFTYEVFPGANHFLLPAPRGLNAEGLAAHTLAPGLLATLRDWLRGRSIVR